MVTARNAGVCPAIALAPLAGREVAKEVLLCKHNICRANTEQGPAIRWTYTAATGSNNKQCHQHYGFVPVQVQTATPPATVA